MRISVSHEYMSQRLHNQCDKLYVFVKELGNINNEKKTNDYQHCM